MSERSYPGVYLEETSSGARPIEGVGTSTSPSPGLAADRETAPRWRRAGRVLVVVTVAALAVRFWRRRGPDD